MTVLIVGKSSTGKSSSLRNLDFSKTVLINAEAKTPPFRKFKTLMKHIYPENTQQILNGMSQMEESEEEKESLGYVYKTMWQRLRWGVA